jgi:uncharacterized protein YkwD
MLKLVFPFLFFLISNLSFATGRFDTIDMQGLDITYLEQLVKRKIDSIRQLHGRQALIREQRLNRAAADQARYLDRNNKVGHMQVSLEKRNVAKRVKYYGVHWFRYLGENVLWKHPERLLVWNKAKRKYEPRFFYTYDRLAESIVRAWVKSKSHYHTMLIPQFEYTGLAISFDERKAELICVQVFAEF